MPGDLDPTFGEGGSVLTSVGDSDSSAADMAIQDDGKIVAIGTAVGPSGHREFAAVRYKPDGSLDPSFDGDGKVTTFVGGDDDYATALAIQPDGSIVLAGYAVYFADSTKDLALVRYHADGSLDQSFATGGIYLTGWGNSLTDLGSSVCLQTDGRIVVAGSVGQSSYDSILVMRFKEDGTPDTTFGPRGRRITDVGALDDAGTAVAIQPDGKVVVAGNAQETTENQDITVVRFNVNGQLDATFDGDGVVTTSVVPGFDWAEALMVHADGRILVAGTAYNGSGPLWDQEMVQYLADGSLDPSFGTSGMVLTDLGNIEYAHAMAIQSDGRIILVGDYDGNGVQFLVARYLPDGSLDTSFGRGDGWTATYLDQGSYAYGVGLQDDGNIVLAGSVAPSGTDVFGLARYVGGNLVPSGLPSDFNGDGYGDLAIGVPWEDIGTVADTGAMNVMYGTPTGLDLPNNQFWDQTATGVSSNETLDGFGYASTTGDFNADGFADLAVGSPAKQVGSAMYAGAVTVLYGQLRGLDALNAQFWTQDSPDVEAAAETNDFFGWATAAGDLNGDGFWDLAIGVPGETVGTKSYAGGVNVLYGSSAGLSAVGDQFWNQDSPNINNTAEQDDQFGASLAIGDFDGNAFEDLAVGVPVEDFTAGADAGAVNVIYGSVSGLTSAADDFWNQDVDGIANKVEEGDWFGVAIAAGDFNGNGFDDLAIGVQLEDLTGGVDAGAVNVIYGTSSGLDDSGDDFWNQDSEGINNEAEVQDQFGISVAAGDFDGDGYDDAAIGVAAEDVSGELDAGGVAVIYGASDGLDDPNDDFWNQDSPGINDNAEAVDLFGYAVMAADFGAGPEDDLVVGVVLEGFSGIQYAGSVNVIYGSPTDLTSAGDQFWNQDSNGQSGTMLDQAEYDDEFGFGLADPGAGLVPSTSVYSRLPSSG